MKIFEKSYDYEGLYDLLGDIEHATDNMQQLPRDEDNFITGDFIVSIDWVPPVKNKHLMQVSVTQSILDDPVSLFNLFKQFERLMEEKHPGVPYYTKYLPHSSPLLNSIGDRFLVAVRIDDKE